LLVEMAVRRDMNKLPDALTGGLMRAIFTGSQYPEGVYVALLERIRVGNERARRPSKENASNGL
jgi:hypothetical protein